MKVFGSEKVLLQHSVLSYRIDLYGLDIDEKGHKDRNEYRKVENDILIKKYLERISWFNFIRINPDEKYFNCMFLSSHISFSEWIHSLQLPECQGNPCSKQARNLRIKWLQLNSNPQPFSS